MASVKNRVRDKAGKVFEFDRLICIDLVRHNGWTWVNKTDAPGGRILPTSMSDFGPVPNVAPPHDSDSIPDDAPPDALVTSSHMKGGDQLTLFEVPNTSEGVDAIAEEAKGRKNGRKK